MKIIDQSHEIIDRNIDPLKLIEICARTCYKSEDKITDTSARSMVKMLLKSQHGSQLEHATAALQVPITLYNRVKRLDDGFLKFTKDAKESRYIISGNYRAFLEFFEKYNKRYEDISVLETYMSGICPEIFKMNDESYINTTSLCFLNINEIPESEMTTEEKIVHAYRTVKFITSRSVTHEFVRHRPCSFCLSGDTIVYSYSPKIGNSPKRWSIKQLFEWQSDKKRKGRLKLINLRSVNKNGVIVQNKIKQIFKTDIQDVFELKTLSGRTIKATGKHKILTPDGWKILKELNINDRVMSNGLPSYKNKEWIKQKYLIENLPRKEVAELAGISDPCLGIWIRKFGLQKPIKDYPNKKPGYGKKGMFSDKERENISKRMTGINNHRWKGDNVGNNGGRLRARKLYIPDICDGCGATKNLEIHHIDQNPKNNSKDNILFLCQQCHKAHHLSGAVNTVFSDKIIDIEKIGQEQTYDIEMENDPHNFVANGIVVHNSQESQRYVRYDGNMEFIKPVWWLHKKGNNDENAQLLFRDSCLYAEQAYLNLIYCGWRPEQAREVLPNSTKTEIIVTCNLSEWIHIFKLRTSKQAHPQISNLMQGCQEDFKKDLPEIFNEI